MSISEWDEGPSRNDNGQAFVRVFGLLIGDGFNIFNYGHFVWVE